MTLQAYELLRSEILTGVMPADAKINISETVARSGLSLGSVREALSRLTSEGLVVAETNKGFRVAPITLEDLEDLTRTRVLIECACLSSAIENGDLQWESGIVSTQFELSRLSLLLDTSDTVNARWTEVHARFHAALVAGCNSPWLLKIREMLYTQAERYRVATAPYDRMKRDLDAEHKELADAALARDIPRATAAMRDHLTRTKQILIEAKVAKVKSA
ncbi:MAG: FCD domain-containing protein [Rhodobacter sp.]|nr:FCD domain-containing protein [Paracoccaceae bacterium]MCC0077570.1 FCD domain-containing protein [Rhodobacter sp.]